MARRQSAEGFESKKKARKQAKINRPQNTRNERETVIIACEDSVSAPLYFNAIFGDLKENHAIASSSLVIAKHGGSTHPSAILNDLLKHKGYQDFDHKWIVIDRDEERTNGGGHPLEDFNNAIIKANNKNIKVAYSNPCFEIWYLLHFEYRNTPIDRDELNSILERNSQYAKNKLFSQVLDQKLQNIAIENSKRLIQSWIYSQGITIPATDNPSTTVHNLVELLNGFKKP